MSATVESYGTTRYRCTCCRKSWQSKTRADRHVAIGCLWDTEHRACPTCAFDERGYPGSYDEPGCEPYCAIDARQEGERWVLHCPEWKPRAGAGL